mmetsp:Transcript_7183/g.9320  ORF Transcript_7183/g.9320 Transcript_7183/m.9320 type:complete len:138 (+) Transcript_7183:1072-1485(+)
MHTLMWKSGVGMGLDSVCTATGCLVTLSTTTTSPRNTIITLLLRVMYSQIVWKATTFLSSMTADRRLHIGADYENAETAMIFTKVRKTFFRMVMPIVDQKRMFVTELRQTGCAISITRLSSCIRTTTNNGDDELTIH